MKSIFAAAAVIAFIPACAGSPSHGADASTPGDAASPSDASAGDAGYDAGPEDAGYLFGNVQDCSPVCAPSQACENASPPGQPPPDGGDETPPAPSCRPFPQGCDGGLSQECLQNGECAGCGSEAELWGYRNGEWVYECLSC